MGKFSHAKGYMTTHAIDMLLDWQEKVKLLGIYPKDLPNTVRIYFDSWWKNWSNGNGTLSESSQQLIRDTLRVFWKRDIELKDPLLTMILCAQNEKQNKENLGPKRLLDNTKVDFSATEDHDGYEWVFKHGSKSLNRLV